MLSSGLVCRRMAVKALLRGCVYGTGIEGRHYLKLRLVSLADDLCMGPNICGLRSAIEARCQAIAKETTLHLFTCQIRVLLCVFANVKYILLPFFPAQPSSDAKFHPLPKTRISFQGRALCLLCYSLLLSPYYVFSKPRYKMCWPAHVTAPLLLHGRHLAGHPPAAACMYRVLPQAVYIPLLALHKGFSCW